MPKKQCDDHVTLMKTINELKTISFELLSLTTTSNANDSITIKTNELKTKFAYLKQHTFDHLDEEESYWPSVFEKYGENDKMIKKDEANIINNGIKSSGEEFEGLKMAFCSVITALGNTELNPSIGKYGILKHTLKPWCSRELCDKFHNSLPTIPKMFIFPQWLDRYEKYLVLIDSINGDVDMMDKLFPQPNGCMCVIS